MEMKKVTQLIDILDSKLVDNLIYLDRLVKLYAKFMQEYRNAEVRSDGGRIIVKFFKVNSYGYMNYTERDFTFEELPEKIKGYKAKLKREFKNRHSNVRLLREREIYKWKKIIEYAKIQMSEQDMSEL